MSVYFVMLAQWSFSTLVFGALLLGLKLFFPRHLRPEVEGAYPKTELMKIGFSQAISSVLVNYALSGTRTAPYLVAILTNCSIPLQFIIGWVEWE